MKNSSYIGCIILILFISSCKKIKLSDAIIEWQPYQIGDVLIFQENSGAVDTIFITEILKVTNADDPLDLFPTYYQSMFVNGEISQREVELDIMQRPILRRSQPILRLESSEKGDGAFVFVLDNKIDDLTCPTALKTISEIKEYFKDGDEEVKIKVDEYYDNMKDIEYDLIEFIWSRKLGYTKFVYKNGEVWTLVNFSRNNESLIH